MDKIRYSLEDIKSLVKKFEAVKKTGGEMINELKEVINARPEVIRLTETSEKKLSFRFFDLVFSLQLEVNSSKIDKSIGSFKTYMEDQHSHEMHTQALENMEFTFDDAGNIQLKDDLYILTPEVFPYYFISKLTEFILNQRIAIKP